MGHRGSPFEHPKTISVGLGSYTSYREDQQTKPNGSPLSQNEAFLLVKGIPTGYIYEEDKTGEPGKLKLQKDLKMTAKWINTYEQNENATNQTLGMLTRTVDSYGYLHIDPSEPTLDMRAAKGDPDDPQNAYDGEDKDSLTISYEYKDGTRYRILLGNTSESGMSQPILAVDLPLYDDTPETNEQEERRRGFQMTGIYMDRKLIGDGLVKGYNDPAGTYYEKGAVLPDGSKPG